MARDTTANGNGLFTIQGGAELSRALKKIDAKVTGKLARGAVAAGANVVRDTAIGTATAVGLHFQGPMKTASGNVINRRGQIPGSIFAFVKKSTKRRVTAVIKVDTKISESGRTSSERSGGSHWTFVEFGSIHNAPRPFLRPALVESAQLAVEAVVDVLRKGVARYNVPGGGGS